MAGVPASARDRPRRPEPRPALLVGTFFNAFLPTGFGGDAYKAFVLGRGASSIEGPLAAAVLDRLAGLAGLAGLTAVGAAIRVATVTRRGRCGSRRPPPLRSSPGLVALVLAARNARGAVGPPTGAPCADPHVHRRRRGRARHPDGMRAGALWGVITAVLLVAAHGFLLSA